MGARDLVRLVGGNQAQPLGTRDPGEERRERSRGAIGGMKILEHEHDRTLLSEAREQSVDALQNATLAPFGRDDHRSIRKEPDCLEPPRKPRYEPGQRRRRRSGKVGQIVIRSGLEDGLQCCDNQRVWAPQGRGRGLAANHGEGLAHAGQALLGFGQEPRYADAAAPCHQDSRGASD